MKTDRELLELATGIPSRAEIASRILAGLVSSYDMRSQHTQENLARDAISLADALITQLNNDGVKNEY